MSDHIYKEHQEQCNGTMGELILLNYIKIGKQQT